MWSPSTSASAIIIILSYRKLSMLNCSPIPVPIALIRSTTSLFASIRSILALSTLRTLPLKAKMAWYSLSLPSLAEPPAELPSTTNSSAFVLSFVAQSASLPGIAAPSRTPLRIILSLAALAAFLALAANKDLPIMLFAEDGFSSKK